MTPESPHIDRHNGLPESVSLRRRGRAAVHRTGASERDIPRDQVSPHAHGFGDLISCQNEGKYSTAIAGKVEIAREGIPLRAQKLERMNY
jgi:hypothetical protein